MHANIRQLVILILPTLAINSRATPIGRSLATLSNSPLPEKRAESESSVSALDSKTSAAPVLRVAFDNLLEANKGLEVGMELNDFCLFRLEELEGIKPFINNTHFRRTRKLRGLKRGRCFRNCRPRG